MDKQEKKRLYDKISKKGKVVYSELPSIVIDSLLLYLGSGDDTKNDVSSVSLAVEHEAAKEVAKDLLDNSEHLPEELVESISQVIADTADGTSADTMLENISLEELPDDVAEGIVETFTDFLSNLLDWS